MEAYMFEISCRPAIKTDEPGFNHASICAIADTEEEAEAMAKNLIMSHSYIVEAVEAACPYSALPLDESSEFDNQLRSKALQREPPCSAVFSGVKTQSSDVEIRSLGAPGKDGKGH
jgi:hypothetical protein